MDASKVAQQNQISGAALYFSLRPLMNKSCKLLVAEDSDNEFILLEIALQEVPEMQLIHSANSGLEIIKYLSGTGLFADREQYPWPDLLLLDLNMPACDGLGVL